MRFSLTGLNEIGPSCPDGREERQLSQVIERASARPPREIEVELA
jgi:hypothetical protein